MSPKVSAIVVSHNSEQTLARCLQGLADQDIALDRIVLVDSGSTDQSFLSSLQQIDSLSLVAAENIGFSRANNLGMLELPTDTDFVFFVNPDVFLPPDFVGTALEICSHDSEIGIVSGRLLGYDPEQDKPSGRIDSTGVERKWYGRWVDRGQGEHDQDQYGKPEAMAALCGALLFCRKKALHSLQGQVFDPDFFLYKEDIELSLRLRKSGWKLLYHPDLVAYHCRGWKNERAKMPYHLRKMAAESEVLLYQKHPSPYMVWALFKYILVRAFRL